MNTFDKVYFNPVLLYCADDMGSVKLCEMLYRTNLLAVVAGGTSPKYADNTVLIWDDIAQKFVMELVFKIPVKAVRLRRDKSVSIFIRNNHR